MAKTGFQNVFPGMAISKDNRPRKDLPAPPSGRDWNLNEKEAYYRNMRKDYNSWKNDAIKLLYEKKILDMGQHMVHKSSLEELMYNAFKNDLSPEEFVQNNPKINA